jgi:hypothetical protein
MQRLVAALLAIAGVLTPAIGASAAVNQAGVGIRLLEAPSTRQDDPRARTYIIDHLSPGTTITRGVEVSNSTSGPVRVQVYAAGAELKDGTFQPLSASESKSNELTTWTRVAPAELDLAPGQKAPASVTIAVPSDAAPGERYGAVWAQLSSAPSGGGGVTQVNRVGVRIYLSVGPGAEPASNFAIDTFTAQRNSDGTPVVKAQVHNTGGRALDLSGELRLSDGPGGLSGGPFPAKLGTTLAIGEAAPVSVVLDKQLPNGPWQASLTLKSGLLERSASAKITFPNAGSSGPAVRAAASTGPGLAIVVVVTVLLVGVGTTSLLVRKRRSRKS